MSTQIDVKKTLHEFRVLVPQTAAGVIIGKGAVAIKEISENTGCSLKVSDSQDPFGTKERILTIRGSTTVSILTAIISSFEKLLTQPQLFVYTNLKPTYEIPANLRLPVGYPGLLQPDSYSANNFAASMIPYLQQPAPQGIPPFYTQATAQQYYLPQPATPAAPPTSTSTPSPPGAPVAGLPPGVTAPIFSTDGSRIIMQMGVPDNLLGVLIGPGGATIKEISNSSGAWALISQKGDLLQGTSQRYVKITGTQPQVQTALNTVLNKLQNAPPRI